MSEEVNWEKEVMKIAFYARTIKNSSWERKKKANSFNAHAARFFPMHFATE